MSDPVPAVRSAADEAVLLQAIKDHLTQAYEAGRARALAEMNRAGSERQRVRDDKGVDLGTVSISEGKWTATVYDETVLLHWVVENAPDEVVRIPATEAVRESYVSRLLNDALYRAAHPDENHTPQPPGIRVVWKDGQLTVRTTKDGKARAARLLAAGGLTELEAPAPAD